MSLHSKIHCIIFPVLLALWTMAAILVGCTDDFIEKTEYVPDTEVEIRGEVIYKPFIQTEVKARSRAEAPDGDQYMGIKSLYVFFFNSEETLLKDYSGQVDFEPKPSEGSTHEHVTFHKKVPSGKYYVYAVANITTDEVTALMKAKSIGEFRSFKLTWDNDIKKDLEMFGVFKPSDEEGGSVPNNEDFEADELITITPKDHSLHSWVRRAASKVTVDFDGAQLKDGVTVYIRNAVLKDVASGALLGVAGSKAEGVAGTDESPADKITCVPSDYAITYGKGEDHTAWPTVTKDKVFLPSEIWNDRSITSFHGDNAKALPCYENMQGTHQDKSKLQDKDGDGIIDSEIKDGVDYGTYLEVEGYYVANRPEYKSEGKIIYRFMLGKDTLNNFDLVRNHHYKITMCFKGYGNDIDWHIEYAEKYLDATYPEDVNYKGQFFVPKSGTNDYVKYRNAGHDFDNRNVITVTSYITGSPNEWIEPVITYTDSTYDEKTGKWVSAGNKPSASEWLKMTVEGDVNEDKTQKQYTFVAPKSDPVSTPISSLFLSGTVGGETAPYNLSNSNGGNEVENTANCYMVGAPGWYCFPLVYGNAIKDGGTNSEAYSSTNIVNHLNNKITAPYIIDNAGINLKDDNGPLSNIEVKLIWQDAKDGEQYLIEPSSISYDPKLFYVDGAYKGGIKFHIDKIQEGNAVIALIDNSVTVPTDDHVEDFTREVPYTSLKDTRAIWSWHIWATGFGFRDDIEKDIRILNHEAKAFDVMPVNLGWCSGGQEIKYYRRRKCAIKFKVGDREIIRTIEQYPHFVLPRGDHPYYQWGRKDPFVGSNDLWKNKKRWTFDGTTTEYGEGGEYNPPRLYVEPVSYQENINRKHTKECVNVLVRNPDKWHNAPRKPDPENPPYKSINISPTDLWSNNGQKTVYDPCPVGYQVSDNTVFTGFTTHGKSAKFPYDWYDVLETNMEPDYYLTDISVNRQVLELYTDTRKLQSITFPVTGYRDYDGKAQIVQYPHAGDGTPANPKVWGEGYVWFNNAHDKTNSYHLKFHRYDIYQGAGDNGWIDKRIEYNAEGEEVPDLNLIAPFESFYNTDGFGIRPVRIPTKQTK